MDDITKIALAAFLHDIGKFAQRAEVEKFDNLEKIIQKADWISSEERKEGETSNFINTNLMSIFSEVSLCNIAKENYFKTQKFTNNVEYSSNKKINENNKKIYKNLYQDFIKEFKNLNLDFEKYPFQNFLDLKSIFEKYTTFIPSSSYNSYPDVSLFDHLLTTAAIATAMYLSEDKEKFYLIQGDFTSIQSFIFSKGGESNKYLAKILRAKSLFVSLITEIIALKICKELNLTPLSILINAGGKFSILAPKNKKVAKVVEKIKEEVNNEFAKINYLQTKFIITFYEEEFKNLSYKKASKVMEKAAKNFEEEKLKFDSDIEVFDDYINSLKDKNICDICGIVPTKEKLEEDIYICKYCSKFKKWGEKFTKEKYKYIKLDLTKNLTEAIEFVEKRSHQQNVVFYSMDEKDIGAIKRVANYVPLIKSENDKRYKLIEDKFKEDLKKDDIKSFYHIAVEGLEEKEDGFYGRKYLAILKADIDNLGQIFIYGFKKGNDENNKVIPIKIAKKEAKDEATFSRIISLSRMIDFYFTSILKKKIKEKYKNIYTVFAGGDDLFLIGHYKEIIALHKELLEDFKEYVKNDDLHLSYAIRFISPNVPITQMAKFAEDDLEKAKDFNKNNSVVFSIKVSNSEILELYKLEEEFKKLNFLSESFLYKLYTFIDMKEKTDACIDIIHNAKWRALFNYYLQKSVSGKKEEREKNIQKAVVIGNWIEKWGEKLVIPLNLYLYSKRKYKKD